ncbi:extensin family protein [Humitalea sp. 24SJ18S-53]|uniref:extensin-like domain-containing protein n=1 Tax=Humitalea sp. 24SJ18S-53 TaxID=3422307 RepID=UPI003D66D9E0
MRPRQRAWRPPWRVSLARFFLILAAVAGLGWWGLRFLPPEWDPRAPLDLNAAPNALTPYRLRWVAQSPAACFAAFEAAGIAFSRIPDRVSDTGCDIADAGRLPRNLRVVPPDPIVTCSVAAAWVIFARNTIQPAALEHLGAEVASVRQLGTYNCRNVNNASAGRRSQHARANAIDIAGFTLRDGREIRLARDWAGAGREAAFLRAVHAGGCRWFRTVLGPDYNAAHRDHFHLDMGPWRSCR